MLCQIEHVGPIYAAKMKTAMSTCMTVTSKAPTPMDYSPKKRHIFGKYTLHCRPSMRFFLNGLVKRFCLIIWTRLPLSVAKLVVDFIFRSLDANLYNMLTLEDCTCIVERRLSWMCKYRPPLDLPNVPCIAHPMHLLVDKTVKEDTFVAFSDHSDGWLHLKCCTMLCGKKRSLQTQTSSAMCPTPCSSIQASRVAYSIPCTMPYSR